ncbi:hypothetical protein BCR44DRAFT_64586 [Catenaria anguillulae PL171]|uniref:H15 domain-containing protein n=1 Tax=Catenaria anguillulae PL171 TaxID=765915 RepID=A0A1Y2HLS2_9FUNG|nr:hypothetical protein BCR44DRAFT_64586 [Catenaria anguillulae PL171]
MASPPPSFCPASSRAARPDPVPTPASSPSLAQSPSSRTHISWQPLEFPATARPAPPALSSYLAPIPSNLLPLSDPDSSDLDDFDASSDLDSAWRDEHKSPQQQGNDHGKPNPQNHHDKVRRERKTVDILSLEKVLAMNAVRRPSPSIRSDQHLGVNVDFQQAGDDSSGNSNLWSPPPMRKAALKARSAKAFADADSADDDDFLELSSASYSDFDDGHDSRESDSDFESNANSFKYGRGKGPTRHPRNTQPPSRARARRSCGVSPSSSRPNSAPTRDFFTCHVPPLASPRTSSPLHPHVHSSLHPINLATTASPLPALARAVLGPLAPLTLDIVAKFEANAERERQEAVGGPRLASYEEMILEALLTHEASIDHDGEEYDGLVPKDMYAYMTSRYPTTVPPNFRGSATQALKKAMRKGLVTRHTISNKYIVNPEYSGALALGRAKPNLQLAPNGVGARPTYKRARNKRQVPVPAAAVESSSCTEEEDETHEEDLMDVAAADGQDPLAQEIDPMVTNDSLSPPTSPITSMASTLSSLSPAVSFGDPRVWTPPPPSPQLRSPDLLRLFTPDLSPSLSPEACRPTTPPPVSRPTPSSSCRPIPPPLDLSRAIPTAHNWSNTPSVYVPPHGLPTPPTEHDKFVTARLGPGRSSPQAAQVRASTPKGHRPPQTCLPSHMLTPTMGTQGHVIAAGGGVISPLWLTSPRKPSTPPTVTAAAAATVVSVEGSGQDFVQMPGSPSAMRPAGRRARAQGELPAYVVVGGDSPASPQAGIKRSWMAKDVQQPPDDRHKRMRFNPWVSPEVSPPMFGAGRRPNVPTMPAAVRDDAFVMHLPPVVPMPGMLHGPNRPLTSPPPPPSLVSDDSVPFTLSTPTPAAALAVDGNKQPIWLPLVPGPDGTWRIWTFAAPAPTALVATLPIALKFEASDPTAASGAYAAVPIAGEQAHVAAETKSQFATYESVPEWAQLRPVTCPLPAPSQMWSQQQPLEQPLPKWMPPAAEMFAPTSGVFDCLPLSSTLPAGHPLGMLEDEGIGLDWLMAASRPASAHGGESGGGLFDFGLEQRGGVKKEAAAAAAAALFDKLLDQIAGESSPSSWII